MLGVASQGLASQGLAEPSVSRLSTQLAEPLIQGLASQLASCEAQIFPDSSDFVCPGCTCEAYNFPDISDSGLWRLDEEGLEVNWDIA